MMDGRSAEPAVHELSGASAPRWDAFVRAYPEGSFFHLAGWKTVIEETLGHRGHYLFAEGPDGIRGVLPLVHIRSPFFPNALVSNAFCVYGGAIALDAAAHRALDARALELAARLGVDHLEYRCRESHHRDWACNADLYATFRKRLDPDPEKNLLAVPRKQRAMVRKGMKAGLASEIDDDVDRFYRVYATSLRDLGTPVLPKRYFHRLKTQFADACEVLTVTRQGRPVSTVLSFYFRDEVLPYYGGSLREARTVAANDFMYWELMRRACGRGVRLFDFGRSKRGTGAYAFKKHWGFTPEPLYHEYKLLRGTTIPQINPLNPKYRIFIAMWKRLPLPVANALGPLLARDLG